MTITIFYSCPLCGIQKRAVSVPVREDGQDVITWMRSAGELLSADHRGLSPFCMPTELKDVYIPMTGRDRIGGPALN